MNNNVQKRAFLLFQEGRWKYKLRINSGSFNISVIVKAKHSPSIDEDPISVRHKVETNLEDHNAALFCDITRGNHPVIGLNVTATIAKHGGQAKTVQLWDNGAGKPFVYMEKNGHDL